MPWFVRKINVRVRDKGGPVAPQANEMDLPDEEYRTVLERGLWQRINSLDGNSRILLFIHGYANDLKDAFIAYTAFASNADRVLGAGSLRPVVGLFFWPGDTNPRWFSPLSYPWEIQPAKDSASRLAEWLQGLRGPGGSPVEIDIIAHSLGCRVTLETLDILRFIPNPTVRIRSVTLMAAAVEEGAVDMREGVIGALRPAAFLPGDRLLLFSESDWVLWLAFPLGQSAAGESFLPTAVGRFGGPQTLPAQRDEYYGAGHSDYWPGEESAFRTTFFLGLGGGIPSIPRRKISSWTMPDEYRLGGD